MLKLVQFTGVYFPDLNPNFYTYDNLNNMKLDLNVSAKVNLVQMTRALNLKIWVITGFLITS